jgi:hypothetical protein
MATVLLGALLGGAQLTSEVERWPGCWAMDGLVSMVLMCNGSVGCLCFSLEHMYRTKNTQVTRSSA